MFTIFIVVRKVLMWRGLFLKGRNRLISLKKYTPASPLRDGGSPESSSSSLGFYISKYLAKTL